MGLTKMGLTNPQTEPIRIRRISSLSPLHVIYFLHAWT